MHAHKGACTHKHIHCTTYNRLKQKINRDLRRRKIAARSINLAARPVIVVSFYGLSTPSSKLQPAWHSAGP